MRTGIAYLSTCLLLSINIASTATAQSDIRLAPQTADVHRTPGIMVRNGGLFITWADGPNMYNADHFVLARWNPGSSGEATTIASLVPEGIWDPPYFVDSMAYSKNDGLVRFDNLASVQALHSRTDRTGPAGHPGQQGVVYVARLQMFVPNETGWKLSKSIEMGRPEPQGEYMELNSWGVDPNTGNIIGAASYRSVPKVSNITQRWVFSLDSQGTELWTINIPALADGSLPPSKIIPIGGQEYLAATDGQAIHMNGATALETVTFAKSAATAFFRRLFGDRFLRYYFSADDRLELEVYNLAGTLLHSNSISISGGIKSAFIVQNPSDSSLAVVWGGSNGVRMTHLDKFLAVHASDIRLNVDDQNVTSPTAVFRNDTLFAVWEHYRDGETDPRDIYGTSYPVPRITTTASVTGPISPRDADGIRTVYPNPAAGLLNLSYETSTAGEASIDLYDQLGRLARRGEPSVVSVGRHRASVDISDLESGLYLLVVRGQGWRASRNVTVLH